MANKQFKSGDYIYNVDLHKKIKVNSIMIETIKLFPKWANKSLLKHNKLVERPYGKCSKNKIYK